VEALASASPKTNLRGGGIFGREEGFLDAEATAFDASAGDAEIAGSPSARTSDAGNRAARKAHAHDRRRRFRIALLFTRETPFTIDDQSSEMIRELGFPVAVSRLDGRFDRI
jgi:hypothetical protein